MHQRETQERAGQTMCLSLMLYFFKGVINNFSALVYLSLKTKYILNNNGPWVPFRGCEHAVATLAEMQQKKSIVRCIMFSGEERMFSACFMFIISV